MYFRKAFSVLWPVIFIMVIAGMSAIYIFVAIFFILIVVFLVIMVKENWAWAGRIARRKK